MGFEIGETDDNEPIITEEARREILAELDAGKLTAEEALRVLRGES